jgi:hypothetical protein
MILHDLASLTVAVAVPSLADGVAVGARSITLAGMAGCRFSFGLLKPREPVADHLAACGVFAGRYRSRLRFDRSRRRLRCGADNAYRDQERVDVAKPGKRDGRDTTREKRKSGRVASLCLDFRRGIIGTHLKVPRNGRLGTCNNSNWHHLVRGTRCCRRVGGV